MQLVDNNKEGKRELNRSIIIFIIEIEKHPTNLFSFSLLTNFIHQFIIEILQDNMGCVCRKLFVKMIFSYSVIREISTLSLSLIF